jgi:hypothetical protein
MGKMYALYEYTRRHESGLMGVYVAITPFTGRVRRQEVTR